eukprot:CAMPEP_0204909808 /NCGR_PEP_ID=MMETSP1397-20131031/8452_1 /ASSEMBLY_ACC=CAM_ASM_000891 /TAXON_ID=49980 /ORGANISM="Climacostomum Climacostomum virens, Strain Stock W-24" /LENGTH=46 /DNA_ID= /DNA_START= /DNA_END= /DNA_ORIENTATION=
MHDVGDDSEEQLVEHIKVNLLACVSHQKDVDESEDFPPKELSDFMR